MLIGIDGGGSKNDLLLFTRSGKVLRRLIAQGGSVSEMGIESAFDRLKTQLAELLEDFGGLNAPIDALFAGLSGGGNARVRKELFDLLRTALPNARSVRTAGDTLTALYASFGTSDGVAVIAGTGSSAFIRSGGQLTTVGGWGHLIDDAGSGFFFGREVLNAALRSKDGRGETTMLSELTDARLHADVRSCISELYDGGKRAVAAFAPLLFEAVNAGDCTARRILARGADELALLIRAAARHLRTAPYRIALIGSLWNASCLTDAVRSRLDGEFELFRPNHPAVLGSALCAAEDAGLDAMSLHDALSASLQAM